VLMYRNCPLWPQYCTGVWSGSGHAQADSVLTSSPFGHG
jgi:hypothetical protein